MIEPNDLPPDTAAENAVEYLAAAYRGALRDAEQWRQNAESWRAECATLRTELRALKGEVKP